MIFKQLWSYFKNLIRKKQQLKDQFILVQNKFEIHA